MFDLYLGEMMNKCWLAILVAVGLIGTASAATPAEGQFDIQLPPASTYLRCVDLNFGDVVNYRFSAALPVSFRIFTTKDEKVAEAVQRRGMVKLTLRFVAPAAGSWCWQWGNTSTDPTRLFGSLEKYRADPQ